MTSICFIYNFEKKNFLLNFLVSVSRINVLDKCAQYNFISTYNNYFGKAMLFEI